MSNEYDAYEVQVFNRAAYSIGCLPQDLKEYEYYVLTMFLDELTERQAAVMVEHLLQGESYYYTKVEPFMADVNAKWERMNA